MRKMIPIREQFSLFHEPTLEEMLSDPIVKAVMRADSVDPGRLSDMLNWVADELRAEMPMSFQKPGGFARGRHPITPSPQATIALRRA
jgi:hypothetical protein